MLAVCRPLASFSVRNDDLTANGAKIAAPCDLVVHFKPSQVNRYRGLAAADLIDDWRPMLGPADADAFAHPNSNGDADTNGHPNPDTDSNVMRD